MRIAVGRGVGLPFIRGKIYVFLANDDLCFITDDAGNRIIL